MTRTVYAEVPSRVECSITRRGLRAIPCIEALQKFGNGARRWSEPS